MKKLYCALALILATSTTFAGTGWYLTVTNASDHEIKVTDVDTKGSNCWYRNGMAEENLISPGESKTIYSEENNSGTCFNMVRNKTKFDNFSIDGHYASLVTAYKTQDNNRRSVNYYDDAEEHRVINGLDYETIYEFSAQSDTVRVNVLYDGQQLCGDKNSDLGAGKGKLIDNYRCV